MKAVYLPGEQSFLRYIEVPGEDPPLLWIHGWQCSSTGELLPAAVQPALRGRRSIAIDLLGHGYSDKPLDFPYTIEAHARTIVSLIDALGIAECGIVGHSMGGAVAAHVAAARYEAVSVLILAEANIDASGGTAFDGQTEAEFVDHGFAEVVARQAAEAAAAPEGIRAAHLEMTRLIEPRALYREQVSMIGETEPPVHAILKALPMPCWYLIGELSEDDGVQGYLASIGVGWKVVPGSGHPMGLQNPAGFAETVAEALAESWAERPAAT